MALDQPVVSELPDALRTGEGPGHVGRRTPDDRLSHHRMPTEPIHPTDIRTVPTGDLRRQRRRGCAAGAETCSTPGRRAPGDRTPAANWTKAR